MNIDEAKQSFKKYHDSPWRPHQRESTEFILNSERKIQILEAPTGSGKTAVAMTSGLVSGGMVYSVHTRLLQTQATEDHNESAVSLFGRDNYTCRSNSDLTCGDCKSTKANPCYYKKSGCPYGDQKKKALDSKLAILNFNFLISEANFVGQFSNHAPLYVVDEADSLEAVLQDFVSLSFSPYALRRLGLTEPARKTSTSKQGIEPWVDFGRMAKQRVTRIIESLTHEIDSYGSKENVTEQQMRQIKERSKIIRLSERIDIFLNKVDKSWLYEENERGIHFKPLWITEDLSQEFLFRHMQKCTLMSASFLPTHILLKTLGIPSDDYDYQCVPSTFPVERRPIYIDPVCNLTRDTMDEEVPKLINGIKKILSKHKNDKGLIHCVSYSLANRIYAEINDPRLIIHNGQNRQETLTAFMDSNNPLVMLSPSFERGVSLNQDLCRFVVVAKAPFLSLADKQTKARTWSGQMGQDWYTATMMLNVLQMLGRGMRSDDDFCTSYILDQQFNKALMTHPSYWPSWIKDAIVF